MKVLIILYNLDLGGIQKKSLDIMSYLVSEQTGSTEVVLGIMIKGGFFYDGIPPKIKVVNLYGSKITLLKLVLDYGPDVIYAPTLVITVLLIKLIVFWLPIKVVVSQEMILSEYLPGESFFWLRKFLNKVLLPKANRIIAVNNTIRRDLIENFSVTPQMVRVIRNWAKQVESFRAQGCAGRRVSKSKNLDLIFAGRLAPEKNLDTIINIAKIIVRELPDLRVKIIGAGPEKNRLKRKIGQEDLEKNMAIKEPVKNIFPELSRSKIFMMTSAREGCPLSLLEAMAVGIPAVVPDIPVMRELKEQNAGVILCADINDFVTTIMKLLKNRKMRNRLGKMSKLTAAKYYSRGNLRRLAATIAASK